MIERFAKSKFVYPITKHVNTLLKKAPRLYRLIRFHSLNPNTSHYWNTLYAKEGISPTRNYEKLHDKIIELCPFESKILDVGCGVGILLSKLKSENGCEVYGIDFSKNAVEFCKGNGVNAIVSELPNVPYPDEMFDVVICSEVLEHLSKPEKTIEQILRVLKAKGIFIITVPYKEDNVVDKHIEHVHTFDKTFFEKIIPPAYQINFDYIEDNIWTSGERWHFENLIVWSRRIA